MPYPKGYVMPLELRKPASGPCKYGHNNGRWDRDSHGSRQCVDCKREGHKVWATTNRKRMLELQSKANKKRHARLRAEILEAYGHACACCGETEAEFLTVDHIDGNGRKHRKKVGIGRDFYVWLVKNGCPKDNFRLLCWNCNSARFRKGYCPHEKGKSVLYAVT